jgi:hypothetical protein
VNYKTILLSPWRAFWRHFGQHLEFFHATTSRHPTLALLRNDVLQGKNLKQKIITGENIYDPIMWNNT